MMLERCARRWDARWDNVKAGNRRIPKRSCSQASMSSARLIFLWTMENLTSGYWLATTWGGNKRERTLILNYILECNVVWVFEGFGHLCGNFGSYHLQLFEQSILRSSLLRRLGHMEVKSVSIPQSVQTQHKGDVVLQETGVYEERGGWTGRRY